MFSDFVTTRRVTGAMFWGRNRVKKLMFWNFDILLHQRRGEGEEEGGLAADVYLEYMESTVAWLDGASAWGI